MSGNASLSFDTGNELLALYRTGAVSPDEAVAAVCDGIVARNPAINAFSDLHLDAARDAARLATARWRQGTARKLEGIPVTVKGSYDVMGQQTTQDSPSFAPYLAGSDNPVVERLRHAGAIILGKTTMSEFAWSGLSRNPVTGITHNPWRSGHNAGASSAGAGAAAAAGFGALHVGSDGAGSIRMPAHFCGVFGFKPTYGRIPQIPVSNNDYATHMGPITRSVPDAALMMEVMAGAHPLDRTSLEGSAPAYVNRLSQDRPPPAVAFSLDLGHARVDPEIAEVVLAAIERLCSDPGWRIREVTPEWGPKGPALGRFFWTALQSQFLNRIDAFGDRMGRDLVACVRAGAAHRVSEYHLRRAEKNAYAGEIEMSLQEWRFLLTPVASVAAFPVDRVLPAHWPQHEWDWLSWAEFMYPFNMSGNPAASVPCGLTRDGLPVGLQIVGRRFDDLGVLQLASAVERVFGKFAAPLESGA